MTVKFYSINGENSIEIMPNYATGTILIDYLGGYNMPYGESIEIDLDDVDDLIRFLEDSKKKLQDVGVD